MRHDDFRMLVRMRARPNQYIVQIMGDKTTAVVGYVYVRVVWPNVGVPLLVSPLRDLQSLVVL